MPARTYLFALVDGGGTVPPEVGAARRLLRRGHRVVVLGEDSMEDDVRESGVEFRPWVEAPNRPDRSPEHDPYRDWECRTPLQLIDRLVETQLVGPAAAYARDVRRAVDELAPDLVVCSEFAFGAMLGAEAARTPFDVMLPNAYMLPAAGMPPFGLGLEPARGLAGRMRDLLLGGFMLRVADAKALPGLNAVRGQFGLAPLKHFWDQIHHARRELVLTARAFDFPGALPDNAVYVGPVLDDPTWSGTWEPPGGTEPLVLVAMSSTFQDHAASLQRAVDALATLPVRGLVTTGPALDPQALRPRPNVTVTASAPHTRVLAHTSALVTHGGHGTVMKALAAGVPMVLLPHGRDQADNAARVALRGAGLVLRKQARAAALADAIRRVLEDPSYRNAAARLGGAVRRDAASGALVRALESVGAPAPATPAPRSTLWARPRPGGVDR